MNLLKQTFPLTLISALRFFGLFVVMPVISVYALSLGATPLMVGLAVGGYALTQIIFQSPFGIMGDKFDKRIVIGIGLVIFVIGSFLCAMTENIYLLILGRMLQGAGAVASVISALISDMVEEEKRTKAMAIMGGGISLSFLFSMLIGPFIGGHYGVKILFVIAGVCAIFSIVILFWKVPKPPKITYSYNAVQSKSYLLDKNLWIMHISAFIQKALMNLGFVIIPLVLHKDFGLAQSDLWKFYAPAGLLGVFAMAPASIIAEKYGKYKLVMILGIFAFGLCFALFCASDYHQIFWLFVAGILVFFVGFDIHEPIMQSLASKYPKSFQRSSALGLFTTFGFLGSFVGAVLGGVLYEAIGLFYLSLGTGVICLLWILLLGMFLDSPREQKTLFLPLHSIANLDKVSTLRGVIDYYSTGDTLSIKYDSKLTTQESIKEALL